jgi:endonuclease G
MKWSEQAVKESDYFTNICPQNKEMNNGVWHQIENLARKLAVRYDSVQIVCGPIFDPRKTETIGPNHVRIPDSFFKAILIKKQDGYHSIAFICPNNSDSVTITGTAQSVNYVESSTGYDFFKFLDDHVEESVENEVGIDRWVR